MRQELTGMITEVLVEQAYAEALGQQTMPYVDVEVWHMGAGGTSGPGGMADIERAQKLTGTAADVLQGMPAGSMDFAKDYLLDITDLATELGWSMEDWYFSPAQSYSPDGKLSVLPFNVSVSGWMYNKNIFEEEGVEEPTDDWTFNGMVEVAKKLTKPEKGQYGVWAKDGEWYGVWRACVGHWGDRVHQGSPQVWDVQGTRARYLRTLDRPDLQGQGIAGAGRGFGPADCRGHQLLRHLQGGNDASWRPLYRRAHAADRRPLRGQRHPHPQGSRDGPEMFPAEQRWERGLL